MVFDEMSNKYVNQIGDSNLNLGHDSNNKTDRKWYKFPSGILLALHNKQAIAPFIRKQRQLTTFSQIPLRVVAEESEPIYALFFNTYIAHSHFILITDYI